MLDYVRKVRSRAVSAVGRPAVHPFGLDTQHVGPPRPSQQRSRDAQLHPGGASRAFHLGRLARFSILSAAHAEGLLKFGWYISILPDASQMFL